MRLHGKTLDSGTVKSFVVDRNLHCRRTTLMMMRMLFTLIIVLSRTVWMHLVGAGYSFDVFEWFFFVGIQKPVSCFEYWYLSKDDIEYS